MLLGDCLAGLAFLRCKLWYTWNSFVYHTQRPMGQCFQGIQCFQGTRTNCQIFSSKLSLGEVQPFPESQKRDKSPLTWQLTNSSNNLENSVRDPSAITLLNVSWQRSSARLLTSYTAFSKTPFRV